MHKCLRVCVYVCGESPRFVCLNPQKIFQFWKKKKKKRGWLSLPWQPSSLQSRHWRRNTPPHKLCQWGYARLRGGVFVNRDIQVKNCLFTKQLFFPLQCKRHTPRPADQLQKAHWLPGSLHQRWNPASGKSHTLGRKTQKKKRKKQQHTRSWILKYLSSTGSNVLYNKCDMFSVSIRAAYLHFLIFISWLISDMEHGGMGTRGSGFWYTMNVLIGHVCSVACSNASS